MKQLLQDHKTGDLKLEEVPALALKPGGVLVKNYYSLVSAGTERAVIEFAKQSFMGRSPIWKMIVFPHLAMQRSIGYNLVGMARSI